MADGVSEVANPFARPTDEARAKLFTHGGSQAVRLPKAFRFEGTEVNVRRDGDSVVLTPAPRKRPRTREEMDAFWAELDALGDGGLLDYPERDPSPGRDPFEER